MTHEYTRTSHPRRRDIHRPATPRRISFRPIALLVSHVRASVLRASALGNRHLADRRVALGVSATLGLAVLAAGVISGASASAGTVPIGLNQTSAHAVAPSAEVSTAPAAVADARVALQRAKQLTSESRTIGAKQKKKIEALSAELRALMGQREDMAASRSGDREPLEDRSGQAERSEDVARAHSEAAEDVEAIAKAESAEPQEEAPAATPGPVLASPADEFVAPSLATRAVPLADAAADVVTTDSPPVDAGVDGASDGAADVASAIEAPADVTEQLTRATEALTELMRDAKADAIEPAPATPEEILEAQARAARKADRELAKQAKSLARYENGQIPQGELCALPFAAGETLRCDAAQQLVRLDKAYRARFGHHLEITDSYRPYASQVATARSRGYLAAVPGYSNHGWAVALDLGGGVQRFGTAQHEWLRKHARGFGWVNPDWAQSDGRKPEAWHWEYVGV